MSFFPPGFDFRSPTAIFFSLCEVDTQDGPARFMIGADGLFVDVAGQEWIGSQLLSVSSIPAAIGGSAPGGTATISFFQDPDAPDLIGEIKSRGKGYVEGRDMRFYIQPFASHAEMSAPVWSPVLWMTRVIRTVTYTVEGAQNRSISLGFESWAEDRKTARRIILNTEGHAALIGAANPSLSNIPTNDLQEEKLWG